LITGGTAGIGRATAIAFARQGARVVVSGRRETEGKESLALVEKAGGEGLFVRADVSREDDVVALVERTVEHFGRLDIAFNNAGVLERGLTTDVTAESYEHIFGINVRGVVFGLKHQITAMLKNGGGSIVNNASVLGHYSRHTQGRARDDAVDDIRYISNVNGRAVGQRFDRNSIQLLNAVWA
jgi:NAD(P)-dependent dehydrogenase (short-subunit alcohol dehydrogenase family)